MGNSVGRLKILGFRVPFLDETPSVNELWWLVSVLCKPTE